LRAKVAEDELEIITSRIMKEILFAIEAAKFAYNNCLHARAQLNFAYKTHTFAKKMLAEEKDHNQGKAAHTLHTLFMNTCKHDIINWKHELDSSYAELRNELGITVTDAPVRLTDSFFILPRAIPPIATLIEFALKDKPSVQIARMELEKARHRLSYEHSRIIPPIDAGLYYEANYNLRKGSGPMFTISVPIFDQNQAQVSKAEHMISNAERTYRSIKNDVTREVYRAYNNYQSAVHRLQVQRDVISGFKAMIGMSHPDVSGHTSHYVTVFYSRTNQLQAMQKLLTIINEVHNSFASLERSVGRLLHPYVTTELTPFDPQSATDLRLNGAISGIKKDDIE
jgi:outer membrane protein TolC